MNKAHLSLVVLFLYFPFTYSLELSQKFGKVTQDELSMTMYANDTSASAVVLYEKGFLNYQYIQDRGFQVNFEVNKKIKILTDKGVDYADISIPYYFRNTDIRDVIMGVEAYAYNLEGGKVVKTKLEKKYVFDEELSSYYHQVKFSIPNVKVGTVIEYKYKRISERIFDIPNWNVQEEIPVISSYYELLIPEYYAFNIDALKGFENINVDDTRQSERILVSYYNKTPQYANSNSRLIKVSAKDIPALKREPHVWNYDDFMTGVRFEIQGTRFPNEIYKNYTNDWDKLEKTLRDETDFGSNIRLNNPYKEEVSLITITSETESEIIEKIYSLVRSKITWNGRYDFMGNKVREAIKDGVGNNAQINIVLLNALKDAGINAYPVLISRRSTGRLPYTYPSLAYLNTFIIMAQTKDGNRLYMDGSAKGVTTNILPTDLLVDRARIYDPGASYEKWVNLTDLGKNQQIAIQYADLDENGLLTCKKDNRYVNQYAAMMKNRYLTENDSTEYINEFQTKNDITIESQEFSGLKNTSSMVEEKIVFTKQYDTFSDYIYINPLIFSHLIENPFLQSERKMPIEFSYSYHYMISTILVIPDNYTVEEVPQSINYVMDDKKGSCLYSVQQNENNIQINYRFQLNQIVFPVGDYEVLREFYGQVATKNNELIVLKKR